MNALLDSQFVDSKHEIVKRGTLVTYVLPYAKTLELTGRLKGVIISGNHYNRRNDRPCICPILHGETSINEKWGVKIHDYENVPSYLRPDLTSFIGISYGEVRPILRQDGRLCIFPPELIRQAQEKFIDIIRPTHEKMAQKGQGFLAYGEIGWSDAFPRNSEDKTDPAPIMNLTPPEIYKQTGTVQVVRGYSHLEKFLPHSNVAVGANHWFDTAFFSVNDLRILPVRGTLLRRSGRRSVPAGERAMKGFAKKELGSLDARVFEEIISRYNAPQGCLPRHVVSARSNVMQQYHR